MKLYEVIPIAKVLGKETLSYFGPDSIELGSLVSIPLRKKVSHAIVINKRDIGLEKASIKSSNFALRKIGAVKSQHFLSASFLKATQETATYFASSTGGILQSLIPQHVLSHVVKQVPENTKQKNSIKGEHLVLQAEDDERFAHYRSFIRGQFARNSSVFFCLPTIEDIRIAKVKLEKGISDYTVILHSKLSKKEFLGALKIIENKLHPVLIICTPPFLSIERNDATNIILDRENSRGWRTQNRPFFDMRVFIDKLATIQGKTLILGDLLVSVETMWKLKNEEYAEFMPIKTRVLSSVRDLLVDMKTPKENVDKVIEKASRNIVANGKFRVLSLELEALIDKTKSENERLLIFSARKGLSPSTVCGDCGQIVICTNCSAPIVLYSKKIENANSEKNFFKCNKCGEERDAMERCTNCNSWKLETLGIGVERVEQEVKKRFPDVKIFTIDKESVKTEKRALEIISKFEDTPGSILLGTELALVYLKHSVENVAVASIDSLFSLPDFRINEKIFYILLTLRSRAEKVFIIQTRNGKENVFNYALRGGLGDFYREEIEDRKTFFYPPFSIFIKLSIESKRQIVIREAERIALLFKNYEPSVFAGFYSSKHGNSVMHIVMRIKASDWPNSEILKIISTLPPQITIRIDPENLL